MTCVIRDEASNRGSYYNFNRYYDADSGQYLSPDPIGFAGGLRPQEYVHNSMEWVDPLGLIGLDASGRPLSSPFYSVWYQTDIPTDMQTGTRSQHFRNANERLYNMLEEHPELKSSFLKEVVDHVQPGARGGFKSTSPPEHTWHHNAQDPTKIELVPRAQHKAPGPVQNSLHPNQQGGFKKLTDKEC